MDKLTVKGTDWAKPEYCTDKDLSCEVCDNFDKNLHICHVFFSSPAKSVIKQISKKKLIKAMRKEDLGV